VGFTVLVVSRGLGCPAFPNGDGGGDIDGRAHEVAIKNVAIEDVTRYRDESTVLVVCQIITGCMDGRPISQHSRTAIHCTRRQA
jgi:hypothetical protein